LKTLDDINQRLKKGKALVLTAPELLEFVTERGTKTAITDIDVVVMASFEPMDGSALLIVPPPVFPRIKFNAGMINGIPLAPGLGDNELYLAAASLPQMDPGNKIFPGEFNYGGGHVIEDLIAGKEVFMEGEGYGSDSFPRRRWESQVSLPQLQRAEAVVPVPGTDRVMAGGNLSSRTIYTQLGILKPDLGNVNYLGSGVYSPILRDPDRRGLRRGQAFLAGAPARVWQRTGTDKDLVMTADLRQMDRRWVRGLSLLGFGVSLQIAVAVAVPILTEADLQPLLTGEDEITISVLEMSEAFPRGEKEVLGCFSFKQLQSGSITLNGKEVSTAPISSYAGARDYAGKIRDSFLQGKIIFSTECRKGVD